MAEWTPNRLTVAAIVALLACGAMLLYIIYGPRPELSPIGKRIHVEMHDKSCKEAYRQCIQEKADNLPSFAED